MLSLQSRRAGFSLFSSFSFISIVALTLIILLSTSRVHSAQVMLGWNPNGENDLAGYKIYYGTLPGISLNNHDTIDDVGNITSHTVSNLISGVTYFFATTAYDTSLNESDFSAEVSFTVPDATPPPVVNNPPVLSPIGSKSVNEGELLSFTVSATDPDGDILTFTESNLPSGATFDVSTNIFSWTPTFSQEGAYSMTCDVSDGIDSDSETFIITVNNVNRSPALDPIADITIDEGDTVVLSPTANDPDGDALTFTYSGWMTSDSRITGFNDAGVHSVTVTVTDGSLTDSQNVAVTVNDIDIDPPTVTSVSSTGDPTKVLVAFSEPVETLSATSALNYSVDNGITISGVSLGADLKTVTLNTSPHSEGITYTLEVNNIKDLASIPNVIALNTTATYTYVAQLVISNLAVGSDKAYEIVDNGLQNGALVYIDRRFTYASVPTLLEGATYIKTANNDKSSSGASFLTFDVNQDVTAYVAHDDRIAAKPSWMASFIDTGENLVTTDVPLSVFKKDFPAGTVTLGGNEGSGNSMYAVVIVGQGAGSTSDTPQNVPSNEIPVVSAIEHDAIDADPNTPGLQVLEGSTVTYNGVASDPDGDILSWEWLYTVDGSSEILFASGSNVAVESVSFTYSIGSAPETYVWILRVSDGKAIAESTLVVDVIAPSDNTPPTISSVSVNGDPAKVVVVFSEPVEALSATNVSNYFIDNGITISDASLSSDLMTLTLSTSQHSEGVTYSLNVINIEDLASIPNVIALNTTAAYTYIAQLVISNLAVGSDKAYEIVDNGLQNGALVYIDRSFTYTSVPTLLEGATFIKTANDDKLSSGASFLTFDVNQDVAVYVAHDDRITAKPSWLSTFIDSGDDLLTSDTTLSTFKKDFLAGTVTLGGNEGPNNSMYTVIIVGK